MDKRRISPCGVLARLGKVVGVTVVCVTLVHLIARFMYAISSEKVLSYDKHGYVTSIEPTVWNYTQQSVGMMILDHCVATIVLLAAVVVTGIMAKDLNKLAKYIILGSSRAKW